MHRKSYARRPSYSAVVSTLALIFAVAAFCVGGAMATGVIVTSKQIKNGTILTQDIHKNAVQSSDIGNGDVKSTDIQNGTVDSDDIGNGAVEAQDLTLPDPKQLQESGVSSTKVGLNSFTFLDTVDTYQKQDPASVLEIDWTGTATGAEFPCIFQLRVDGQASAAQGGGTVFVGTSPISVSVSALFSGLPPGPHTIEIWAMLARGVGEATCTVGPPDTGVSQTFVVSEQVI